ncbi:MAG TPA: DUF262 domain-containing protein [Candidatus Corynebacterium avicola]|uniref:DUF262 domain-containing protein n=1 Tax=Candidatus Corynebacterium avicola TaxID=2838527 RepID=A0A9D1RR18_9CORY|nr:DUF262 domain-containing protein [Candidatus Corynebacterium avicola]
MDTDVHSPKAIFHATTRLVVPLFQRPYVWSEEKQWAPLWEDITRLIDVIDHHNQAATHFLGAIVIQLVPTPLGSIQTWNVIDGQQRLTTLQLLLSALHNRLTRRGWDKLAGQIKSLIENSEDYRQTDEDKFKLWPTNRDRAGFIAAMNGNRDSNDQGATSRLEQGHSYFANAIDAWLGEDEEQAFARGRVLVAAVQDRLEIATIRLNADEDAQAIFETLNARGTPLSAADLIKNFVFQNLNTNPAAAEESYRKYWSQFEAEWWEEEVTSGRLKNPRSSLFLWQWLTTRTLEEFPIREVFRQFKYYVTTIDKDIADLLPQIRVAADRYQEIIRGAARPNGPLNREELFSYRIRLLDSEVARPLIIWLNEPEQADVPRADREKVLALLETWLVRRMLVKATSAGNNRFVLDVIRFLEDQPNTSLPDALAEYLTSNTTKVGYWPSDADIRSELTGTRAFNKYVRARLRMVLEALEDNRRGYPDGRQLAMGPISRGKGTVEHIMPQKWRKNWMADLTEDQQADRDSILHQLGNLTLVTQKLNSKVNNGAWSTKREFFRQYDDVMLTRDAVNLADGDWDETAIEQRTEELIGEILDIWPVPAGFTVANRDIETRTSDTEARRRAVVTIADLVTNEILPEGTRLRPTSQSSRWRGVTAKVTGEGKIAFNGTEYAYPSPAARAVTGTSSEPGWAWWSVAETGHTLNELRNDYLHMND